MNVRDAVVVVTGGCGGDDSIGQSLAGLLADKGATVVVAGPWPAQPPSPSLVFSPLDVCDEQSTAALAADVAERWGRVDALVLAAGVTRYAPFDVADAALEEHLRVNTAGLLATLRALRPLLVPGAPVLLPSTTWVGSVPAAGMGPYAASKAAAEALLLSWDAELRQQGTAGPRVVIARLGPVATPAWHKMGLPPDAVAQAQQWTAMGEGLVRLPSGPETSAPLAALLEDDAASGIVVVDEAAHLRAA
jgi:NAD(P)-dependent dehydrogenase (short-subunit alcohol dehydrogenase family)